MVGAILTQNTNWHNVERALVNLKEVAAFTPQVLYALPPAALAQAIRPAGYFNLKTQRLRNYLQYFLDTYAGDVDRMGRESLSQLRAELLGVTGIGPETADSILLYALEKPIFVVDAYTHRVLQRHHLSDEETTYDALQAVFMDQLPADVPLFNEYHALIVAVGKQWCKRTKPQCALCPLEGLNWE
jgi:endonuclease III related protein